MKSEIYDYISKGDTKTAIDRLKNLAVDEKSIALISNQYRSNEESQMLGIVDNQEYRLELNKINFKILNLADSINITEVDSEHITLNQIHTEIVKLSEGQSVILNQAYENFNLAFGAVENIEALNNELNQYVRSNMIPMDEEWYDQKPKTKLKLVLPFIVGRIEKEYDFTEAKIPKKMKDFVSLLIKK